MNDAARKMELAQRLMKAGRDWVMKVPALHALLVKLLDENKPITPETNKEKPAALIITASDEGRTVAYAPIRNLRLGFEIRANSKISSGQEEAFHGVCGELEALLDSGALQTDPVSQVVSVLSPVCWGVAVMLAVRQPGVSRSVVGDIRSHSYMIDVKAVKAELTGN